MDTLRTLGPWWLVMGAAFAVALVVPLVLGVLTAMRFRIPAFLWLIGPLLVVLAGLAPALLGGIQVAEALVYVDPAMRLTLASAGYAETLPGPALASLQASAALVLAAVALAIGAAVGAGEARFTPAAAGASVGVTLLGATATGLWALLAWEDLALLAVPVVGFVVGLAAAIGGVRIGAEPPDAARGAAARGTIALLGVLAVVLFAVGLSLWQRSVVFQAVAYASPDFVLTLVASGWARVAALGWIGVVTALWVALAGAIPAIAALPDLQGGSTARTAIGAVGSALVVALGAVGLGGTSAWLAGMVSAPEPLLDAARYARDLPVAEDASGLYGQCLLTPLARGWHVRPLEDGVACSEGDASLPIAWEVPVVAVAADTPAHLLASTPWYGPGGGHIHLLVRTGEELPEQLPPQFEAFRYGTLPIEWVPPGEDPVAAALGSIIVPAPDWSVQDLVDACARARFDRWDSDACRLQGFL